MAGFRDRASLAFEHWIRPGAYLFWNKQIYRVSACDPLKPLAFEVEHIGTLERMLLSLGEVWGDGKDDLTAPLFAASLEELHTLIARQQPAPAVVVADGLPATLLEKAEHMIQVVETVERLLAEAESRAELEGMPFRRTAALEQILCQQEEGIKRSTFYKYARLAHYYHGSTAQLAAALRRSTFHQTKFDKAQLHCLDTHIVRFYARSAPLLRPITLYRLLQATMKRTETLWIDPEQCGSTVPQHLVDELLNPNVPMPAILAHEEKRPLLRPIRLPSQSWFYQYLRWFAHLPEQGKAVLTGRYGHDVWEREHAIFDTFAAQALFPLQYVFADHYLLDVFTVDEATRSRLNRLWLTVLLDAYSRSVLGMALLYEPPCIESIQSALRHAIWPKTSHQHLGIPQAWACYGIPERLFLDNAWAHHSFSLEDLARQISQGGRYPSIELDFRPPYKARYGALIERFFGNLAARIKELLPGAIRSSEPKQLRRAAKEACLLYQDVDRFLQQELVAYQHTPHGELEHMTPHQKWLEGLQHGVPVLPRRTPGLERLFWRAAPAPRVIGSKGVSAFGWHYWSPELGGLPRHGREGTPIPYTVRYEPADITRLALFREGKWVGDVFAKERRLPDGSTRPVSLAERQMAKELAQDYPLEGRDWLVLLTELDALKKRRQAERRRSGRQRTRAEAAGQEGPPMPPHAGLQPAAGAQAHDYTDLLAQFMERS